jgi:hypothetical protein
MMVRELEKTRNNDDRNALVHNILIKFFTLSITCEMNFARTMVALSGTVQVVISAHVGWKGIE